MNTISTQGNMSQQIAGMLTHRGVSGHGKGENQQQSGDKAAESSTASASLTDNASLNPTLLAYLFNLNSTSATTTTDTSSTSEETLTSAIDDAFSQIDANGDGSISKAELESAETSSGLSTDDIDALYDQLDSSGTGITKSAFEDAVTNAVESAPPMPPPPPPEMSEGKNNTTSTLSSTVQTDFDKLAEDLSALSSSVYESGTVDESALTDVDSSISSLLQNLRADFEQLVSDMSSASTTSRTESATTADTSSSTSTAASSSTSSTTGSTAIDMASLLKAIDSYLIASLKEQASSSTPSVA